MILEDTMSRHDDNRADQQEAPLLTALMLGEPMIGAARVRTHIAPQWAYRVCANTVPEWMEAEDK